MRELNGLRQALPVVFAAIAVMVIAAPARAQGLFDRLPEIPGAWTLTLGVQGKVAPEFDGAKDFDVTPLPVFGLRRAGTTARFRAPLDGPSIALIDTGRFFLGPTGKFKKARKESDHEEHLRGLGDVDWTIEVGAFAEFWPTDWFRTRAEVRRGFKGHEGIVADLSADAVIPFDERWTISGGPRLTLSDTKAISPYFGIDALQSLRSGLAAYEAKGGLYSAGAGLQATYRWTPQWEVRSYVEYSRLLGDAASSPLVLERGSRNQLTFGMGVSYAFDIKLW